MPTVVLEDRLGNVVADVGVGKGLTGRDIRFVADRLVEGQLIHLLA